MYISGRNSSHHLSPSALKWESSCDKSDNYQSNSMASEDSDDAFLSRIMVNYIRHDLSSYEERLDMLFGRVGKREAYRILLKKIYKAIKKAYPSLADECNRQLSRKL